MQLFFSNDINADLCQLTPEESKHCVKVLRMRVGDQIHLTDGCGTLCFGHIAAADSNACLVAIDRREEHFGQRPYRLHLAVAPTKNNARIEWMLEKAVEIGIDELTPIVCDHSERDTLKVDRLEKIVVSAMKQSLKTYRPTINAPTLLHDFLQQTAPLDLERFICHCDGDRRTLHQLYHPGRSALVLIGPEGDFSNLEISVALKAGFQPVTLGSCRLRTETAALYAITVLNFLNT